jgi:type II secretory pathway component GspD/PulD (secretin)
MRTQVDAQFGTPLLLSGLLQEDIRKQARGIPGLRQIPILGALFGSEDFQKEQSELVAILLPQVLPPSPILGRVGESLPKGHIPPARNWISESNMREMQADPNYPWNAFEN